LHQKTGFKFQEQTSKVLHWSTALGGVETGHFGEQIRSTWKILKGGAGEGWRGLVGQIG